jgi:hypothetical protein
LEGEQPHRGFARQNETLDQNYKNSDHSNGDTSNSDLSEQQKSLDLSNSDTSKQETTPLNTSNEEPSFDILKEEKRNRRRSKRDANLQSPPAGEKTKFLQVMQV